MALVCKNVASKHFGYQCIHRYSGDDKYMLERLCRPCLEEQKLENEVGKNG